jgi:hypothetical protein
MSQMRKLRPFRWAHGPSRRSNRDHRDRLDGVEQRFRERHGTKVDKIILSLIKQTKLDLIDVARDSELSEKELSNAKLKVQ